MKMTKITMSVLGLLGVASLANESEAALKIDFRFSDGSQSRTVNQGDLTPITFNAWAVATGAAGNANPEGLKFALFALKSKLNASGIGGSITSSSYGVGWNGPGAFTGSASNISPDGIGDWGSVTNLPLTLTNAYYRVRTTKTLNNQIDWGDTDSPAGSTYNSLPDGVEFLVGSFTFTPTSAINGASLMYVPVSPLGGTNAIAGWFEDSSNKFSPEPAPGGKTQSTGIYTPLTPNSSDIGALTINVIPEPTSLGVLGLLGVQMLRRRGR